MALGLSACGGSSNGGAGSSGFSEASRSAAQEQLDKYTGIPEPLKLAPLAKPPARGKVMAMVSCTVPTCTTLSNEFKKAAEVLGWNVRVFAPEYTPEAFGTAWDSALAVNPDGIYYFPLFPNDTIRPQLEQAKKAGIPIVGGALPEDTKLGGDSPITANTQAGQFAQIAALEAQMVIVDSKSEDGFAYLYQPGNPAYESALHSFEKVIEEAEGKVDAIKVNQANAGTTLPGEIVSYLQSHPDTKYLACPGAQFLPGVVEAIKAAGIPMPKIITLAAELDSPKLIKSGDYYGAVLQDVNIEQWLVVDFFARYLAGEKPDPKIQLDPMMVLTSDNVDKFPGVLPFPGTTKAFTEAWGVS